MASSGSFKYLYERLGEKRFQQLCAALVVNKYPDVRVFPVGERDGGRDITLGTGNMRTILQVKWTSNRSRKSASWLTTQVNAEADNIRRLVKEGCKQYILVTNVEGSAAPNVGTRDAVEKALDELSVTYGVPMSCVWAADLDAWVDAAPFEIKMAYVDMLAGTDALFALLQSQQLDEREERDKSILITYVATHWKRDKHVKFHQVDFASDLLSDLFVDLTATRTRGPRNLHLSHSSTGPVVEHLLDPTSPPLTLIEGVPGQGKSTVAQYVSQVYRAEFVGRDKLAESNELLPEHHGESPRVSIRVDLADYAEWINGNDPFATEDPVEKSVARMRKNIDLERFLVEHLDSAAAGHDLRIDDVRSILDRFPSYLVLDGLDEVASTELRARIVDEIDAFTTRWVQRRPGNMRILVTTRPNASGLSEPAPDLYDKIILDPLDDGTRKRYLRRWASAQHIDATERRRIQRVFDERASTPHVAQLANNPMQLTILLHLIRTKGESLPTARTSLYRAYMDLFLEREATKSKMVLDNRPDLEEATSYIGWFMQSLSEVDASATRLPEKRIVREMTKHLATVGKTDAPVKNLFDAMSDRVWVLTSKQSGTYEFDVQSIREFFAARFLYEYAGLAGDNGPAEVLIELLPRSYWANTARFLGGHFLTREVPNVADLIQESFEHLAGARQARTTLWTLLSDGIFTERVTSQRRVAELLADDLSVRFLAEELTNALALPPLPSDHGGDVLSARLLELLGDEPHSPLRSARVTVAQEVTDPEAFCRWWAPHMDGAAGGEAESAWLATGRAHHAGASLSGATMDRLAIGTPDCARAALQAGLSPADGTTQANRLLEWTLGGHCSEVVPVGTSEAADLLRVVAPHVLLAMAGDAETPAALSIGGHHVRAVPQRERTAALRRLADRHSSDSLQKALRVAKGEKGTTSRWVNTARSLAEIYGGPCWLATEIVAIAAALSPTEVVTGGSKTSGAPCFGEGMDYGQWLPNIRQNRSNSQWWAEQRTSCSDDHSSAAWVLGLMLAADTSVVAHLLPDIDAIVSDLPVDRLHSLVASVSRISTAGLPRQLDIVGLGDGVSATMRLLIAHLSGDPRNALGDDLDLLHELMAFPIGGWPAYLRAIDLTGDEMTEAPLDLLEALGPDRSESFIIRARMSEKAAEHMLKRPELYPIGWLEAADRSLTSARYSVPLKAHAETHWEF